MSFSGEQNENKKILIPFSNAQRITLCENIIHSVAISSNENDTYYNPKLQITNTSHKAQSLSNEIQNRRI